MRLPAPSSVALRREPAPISISSFPAITSARAEPCGEPTLAPLFDELRLITTSTATNDATCRFDVLLRRVGRALCQLLDLTRCSVYLSVDGATFRGLVGFTATRPLDASVRASSLDIATDLVTAELVRTRAPVVVADARTDARPLASVVRRLGICDLVAVPLVVDDVIIGAVYLDDEGRPHEYAAGSLARASAYACHASSVVRQAQIVLALRRGLDRARVERELLERTTQGQLSIDAAAIAGGCATQLVAHITEALDRPVLLLGDGHDLLHVAGTDDGFSRALRAAWRPDAFARHVATAAGGRSPTLPPLLSIGLGSRMLVSPIGATIADGALVALEVGRPFDVADRRVIDRGASVLRLAEHAASTSRAPTAERSAFGSLSTATVDARVGFPAVVVWLDGGEGAAHDLINQLALPPGGSVLLPRSTGIGVVVPAASATPVVALVAELGHSTPGAAPILAVVSRVAKNSDGFGAACAEVDAIAAMLEANGARDRVVSIDELGGARLVLAAASRDAVARIVDETLVPLAPTAVGTVMSTVLLDTARVLIATDGSIREAARRLEVHENTVRYRMRRISELTDLDMAAVGDLFELQVGLCAWEQLGFPLAASQ